MHDPEGVFCKTAKLWKNRQIRSKEKNMHGPNLLGQQQGKEALGVASPWAMARSMEEAGRKGRRAWAWSMQGRGERSAAARSLLEGGRGRRQGAMQGKQRPRRDSRRSWDAGI